jgi:hypothetical protein
VRSTVSAGARMGATQLPFAVSCEDVSTDDTQWLHNVRPSITGLLLTCGPSAVVGGVGTVIVDAVQRQAIRTAAHIRQEVLKGFPAVTDLNPSASVQGVRRIAWIQAPILHRSPHEVFRGAGESVLSCLLETSAASFGALFDLSAFGSKHASAHTTAGVDVRMPMVDVRQAENLDTVECVAGNVDMCRHKHIVTQRRV